MKMNAFIGVLLAVVFSVCVCNAAPSPKEKPNAQPGKKQAAAAVDTSGAYLRRTSWQETLLDSRQAVRKVESPRERKDALALAVWRRVEADFPVEWDWAMQDGGNDFHRWLCGDSAADMEQRMIRRVLDELGPRAGAMKGEFEHLRAANYDVRLSRDELDKFICWIDLAVPFCGDYDEANAWTEEELKTYAATIQKRAEQEALDRRNIEELIRERRDN